MKLALRQMKEDDERFGHKKGDVVVVDLDYDYDPEKVECLGAVKFSHGHSFYKTQLKTVDNESIPFFEEANT